MDCYYHIHDTLSEHLAVTVAHLWSGCNGTLLGA